jgi:hypothetical protein
MSIDGNREVPFDRRRRIYSHADGGIDIISIHDFPEIIDLTKTEEYVAEEQNESRRYDAIQLSDGIRDAKGGLLFDEVQFHVESRPISEFVGDKLLEMSDHDVNASNAQRPHGLDLPNEQGPIDNRQQRLWQEGTKLAHATPLPGSENHALDLAH